MNDYLALAYAPSTNKARDSAVVAFERWCTSTQREIWPSEDTLCEYVAFLANSGFYLSIKTYLSAINTYHKLQGHHDCLANSFKLKTLQRGVKRAQAHAPRGKHPLTPVELRRIRKTLDWSSSRDRTFWACLVIGFWTFLRGGNLVPKSASKFDANRHLSPLNMTVGNNVVFSLMKTKTVQFAERILVLPLVALPGNELCPVSALVQMWDLCPLRKAGPLFVFSDGRGACVPLLHSKLNESMCC